MKIKFTNIGKVGNAVIDLSGLSVIAGANDSGKSTIGKTIFALIKALNTTKEIYFKEVVNYFVEKFEKKEKGVLLVAGEKNTFKKVSIRTVFEVLKEGKVLTKDLNGNATTSEFTNEIIKKIQIA